MINDVKRFSRLFCHLSIFSGEASGQIFYLSIGLFSCQESSSYILNTGPLSSIKFTSIFCLWLFIQFLAVCFTGDLSSSLAACWRLLSAPYYVGLSTGSSQHSRLLHRGKWVRETGKQVFFITQSSKWHFTVFAVFCSFEASYQVWPTLRGKGLHKGMKSRR